MLDSPNHTVVHLPPIIYRVPAFYRRRYGPFAQRDLPPVSEPLPVIVRERRAFRFVYKWLCVGVIAGAASSFVKVFL